MDDEQSAVQEAVKGAIEEAIKAASDEDGDELAGSAIVVQGRDLALLIPNSGPYLITITPARFQVQGD